MKPLSPQSPSQASFIRWKMQLAIWFRLRCWHYWNIYLPLTIRVVSKSLLYPHFPFPRYALLQLPECLSSNVTSIVLLFSFHSWFTWKMFCSEVGNWKTTSEDLSLSLQKWKRKSVNKIYFWIHWIIDDWYAKAVSPSFFFDILKASTFGNLIIYWNQAIFPVFGFSEHNDRSEIPNIASDSDGSIHFKFLFYFFKFFLHTLNNNFIAALVFFY